MSATRECVCTNCKKTFFVYNAGEWQYKRRDFRKDSESFHKLLWFCTNRCMTEYEKVYPKRKYSKGFKYG